MHVRSAIRAMIPLIALAQHAPAVGDSALVHRSTEADGLVLHSVEGGDAGKHTLLFLHGFPEDWSQFEPIMRRLQNEGRVIAIDLPGIGGSQTAAPANDKRTLARYMRAFIQQRGLNNVTLVGHDIGGDIAYAYLHAYPGELAGAVIMDVSIPGVEPWSTLQREPLLWFWHFHAIPELPEELVDGRQAIYFRWFLKNVSANPAWVTEEVVQRYAQAYSTGTALRTAFDWFRNYAQDARDNQGVRAAVVRTPVLYLGGEKSTGQLREAFEQGLREGGLQNLEFRVIPGAGHYVTGEQPERCAEEIRAFIRRMPGSAS